MSVVATISAVVGVQLAFLDGIAFDPFFRGLLSVLVAVIVLIGGTYLVVATDVGTRLGFLVSLAALFGWMFLMGIIWTIYGIGWRGNPPTWALVDIVVDDQDETDDGLLFSDIEGIPALTEANTGDGLPVGGLGTIDNIGDIDDPDEAQVAALAASEDLDLGDYRYLVTSDGIRGEAQASADAYLVEEGVFAAGDYLPLQFGAFIVDGKPIMDADANVLDRVVHTLSETILHPTFDQELIVIQVQAVVQQPTLPGQAPPVAAIDSNSELVSVIMERDRGGPIPSVFSGLRFTSARFTIITGLIFAVLALNLHWRDQRETKIREAA